MSNTGNASSSCIVNRNEKCPVKSVTLSAIQAERLRNGTALLCLIIPFVQAYEQMQNFYLYLQFTLCTYIRTDIFFVSLLVLGMREVGREISVELKIQTKMLQKCENVRSAICAYIKPWIVLYFRY